MQAHANDLRAEVADEWDTLSAQERPDDKGLDAFVHQVVMDWRQASLAANLAVLLEYAEKTARSPELCTDRDIARLREAGWSDTAIHDAVQTAAYFGYINRVVDALGVEEEEGLPQWGPEPE